MACSLVCASALGIAHAVDAASRISLHALFKDKAIIIVDGTRRVLKTGEISAEGIKLVSTDTRDERAEIEIDGIRQELKLGVVISSYVSTGAGSVTLYAGSGGHFYADGLVNGVAVRFIVDTGATTIAMNAAVADRVGIDYRRLGKAAISSTAGGFVRSYQVKLDSVQVGDIKVYGVDANVVEASSMREVLLGMSFLGRLDMKRDGDKLELIQRY